jgi:hypothetical protein
MSRLAFILSLILTSVAIACPNCKEAVPTSDAQTAAGLPAGFNFSIYYMLVGMMSVLGLITWTIIKGVRSTSSTHSP